MQGTSRAGWVAIHIAAERAGIARPVCGDGIDITYREIPGAGGQWEIHFVGSHPGQKMRLIPLAKLEPSVRVERHSVSGKEVEERMALYPQALSPHLVQAQRMAKAFGPR